MKKASVTVETTLVFPLFFFAVVTLVYIIMWFQTAEKVQSELVNEARIISASSYMKLADEKDMNENVELEKNYFMDINCPILSLIPIKMQQSVYMRKFIGVSVIGGTDESDIVYVTANGRVYHRDRACTYLKVKIEGMAYSDMAYTRNISGEKYKRCVRCAGKSSAEPDTGTTVYISKYGNRYHLRSDCNAIARNVMPIRLNETDKRKACSKCG